MTLEDQKQQVTIQPKIHRTICKVIDFIISASFLEELDKEIQSHAKDNTKVSQKHIIGKRRARTKWKPKEIPESDRKL